MSDPLTCGTCKYRNAVSLQESSCVLNPPLTMILPGPRGPTLGSAHPPVNMNTPACSHHKTKITLQ